MREHPEIRITVLGSGTSVGVPSIGCACKVCRSPDPRDKRLRPSILIGYQGRNVLVDTTPDFRQQALRSGIERLDAILLTHSHADHVLGLDDVRPFNHMQRDVIPLYGSEATLRDVRQRFDYIFHGAASQSSRPKLECRVFDGAEFDLFGLPFQPVRASHGEGVVWGFRFGPAAYMTDHSDIPDASMELLRDLDVLFLDALRYKPHPTHSTVGRSLGCVERLKPRRAFFTHICHDLEHARAESLLPAHVRLAFDGLEIVVEERRNAG
ncbi:MAG: MBL fold metallo-hydrolase [Acidobacteria bacterium]|nr:MBL fold metallo-hydrolase [Acidobacteriota bacterium]